MNTSIAITYSSSSSTSSLTSWHLSDISPCSRKDKEDIDLLHLFSDIKSITKTCHGCRGRFIRTIPHHLHFVNLPKNLKPRNDWKIFKALYG